MTPRRYTQGSRATAAEHTRARIIDAAVAEYRERGLTNATVQSIARRADVSRGTVLNHFGDLDGLLIAVVETALASLDMPDARALEGATDLAARARIFAQQMLRFYGRTEVWWHVFAGERDELPVTPSIQAAEQVFWEQVGAFQQASLGSVAFDPRVVGAMALLVSWNTVDQIKTGGLDTDTAIELAANLFTTVVLDVAAPSQVGE